MSNLYEEVTNQIVALLEQGEIPWHKPWAGAVNGAISYGTGKPYSLLNQILLQTPGEYITFGRCIKEGGNVRKGAKARHVYVWKPRYIDQKDENGQPILNEDGTVKKIMVPFLKSFPVFHLDDCERIKPRWTTALPVNAAQPIDAAEQKLQEYIDREHIRLIADQITGRAYYSPAQDLINIPCIGQYSDPAEYYSTAFHEATHSTGHPARLHRFEINDKNAAFGSESYSKEELTAEIGAACILHYLGISTSGSLQNSAAYVQGWLKALKDDRTLIIGAAARAEKAMRLILDLKDEPTADEE